MKRILYKNIAIREIKEKALETDKLQVQLKHFQDILGFLKLLENPDEYARLVEAEEDESIENRVNRLISQLDIAFIRHNLEEYFIQEAAFQDCITWFLDRTLATELSNVRNVLWSLFYQIFDRKLEAFREVAAFALDSWAPEQTERGVLLLKLKNLEIEVFEEVGPDEIWSNEQLEQIFKAVCDISYTNQAFLTLVRTITHQPEDSAPMVKCGKGDTRATYSYNAKAGKIVVCSWSNLKHLFYRMFGIAIIKSDFFFPWHIDRKFRLLSWASRLLSKAFGLYPFFALKAGQQNKAEDFATIFEFWHTNRERLLARTKYLRAILLRWKISVLKPILGEV